MNLNVTIDWTSLHQSVSILDTYRRSAEIGKDGFADAFGGSYKPELYERDGLAGVVRILEGVNLVRQDAWKLVHSANHHIKELEKLGDRKAIESARFKLSRAVQTAIACHTVMTILHEIGVVVYDANTEICGVHDGYINLTGIFWLLGDGMEPLQGHPTIEQALNCHKERKSA